MKSLGDIYGDSFDRNNKWYEIVWFYTAMVGIFLWLIPGAIWRYATDPEIRARLKAIRALRRQMKKKLNEEQQH